MMPQPSGTPSTFLILLVIVLIALIVAPQTRKAGLTFLGVLGVIAVCLFGVYMFRVSHEEYVPTYGPVTTNEYIEMAPSATEAKSAASTGAYPPPPQFTPDIMLLRILVPIVIVGLIIALLKSGIVNHKFSKSFGAFAAVLVCAVVIYIYLTSISAEQKRDLARRTMRQMALPPKSEAVEKVPQHEHEPDEAAPAAKKEDKASPNVKQNENKPADEPKAAAAPDTKWKADPLIKVDGNNTLLHIKIGPYLSQSDCDRVASDATQQLIRAFVFNNFAEMNYDVLQVDYDSLKQLNNQNAAVLNIGNQNFTANTGRNITWEVLNTQSGKSHVTHLQLKLDRKTIDNLRAQYNNIVDTHAQSQRLKIAVNWGALFLSVMGIAYGYLRWTTPKVTPQTTGSN